MQQRYCGNCGNELVPDNKFCGNCGSPIHATARVPTPEADVPTPPPPQHHQPTTEVGRETRGPMLALVGVFLVLGIGKTAMEMPSAGSGESMAYRLGVGVGAAIVDLFFVAVLVLVLSGVGYLQLRSRGSLTFRHAIFSWPVVGIAAFVALLFVV
jgi:hypothetical protein